MDEYGEVVVPTFSKTTKGWAASVIMVPTETKGEQPPLFIGIGDVNE
jgi:hypothetical protein